MSEKVPEFAKRFSSAVVTATAAALTFALAATSVDVARALAAENLVSVAWHSPDGKDKLPLNGKGWPEKTPAEGLANVEQHPEANIGFKVGQWRDGWLVIVDIDKAGGLALFLQQVEHGALPLGPRVITGNGCHVYFYVTSLDGLHQQSEAARDYGLDLDGQVELFTPASNRWMSLPPSIHPNGRVYQWVNADLPVPELPRAALDWLINPTKAKRTVGSVNDTDQRHNVLKTAAVAFRKQGFDLAAIRAGLEAQNAAFEGGGLPDLELTKLLAWVESDVITAATDSPYVLAEVFAAGVRDEFGYCAALRRWFTKEKGDSRWLWDSSEVLVAQHLLMKYGQVFTKSTRLFDIVRLVAIQPGIALTPDDVAPTRAVQVFSGLELLKVSDEPALITLPSGIMLYPQHGTGVAAGTRTTFKSFTQLDLALWVALAAEVEHAAWHGATIHHPGFVFYVAAEDDEGIRRRIAAWCFDHHLDVPPRAFRLVRARPVITDPQAVSRLCEKFRKELGDNTAALIVFDTYAKTLGPGRDENSNTDATDYEAGMQQTASEVPGNPFVVTIHHENKVGGIRGASAICDNADVVIHQTRDRDLDQPPHTYFAKLWCEKTKSGPEFKDQRLTFQPVEVGVVPLLVLRAVEELDTRSAGDSGVTKKAPGKDKLFDAPKKMLVFRSLALADPTGLTWTELEKAASSKGLLSEAMALLEDREFVRKGEDGRHRLTTAGRQQAVARSWIKLPV